MRKAWVEREEWEGNSALSPIPANPPPGHEGGDLCKNGEKNGVRDLISHLWIWVDG